MKKITTLFLPLAMVSLLFHGNLEAMGEKTVYYYNLRSLKKATAPEVVKMINIENLSTGRQTIERGILFTCLNRHARNVSIAGTFSRWRGKVMRRSKYGVWYYFSPAGKLSEEVSYKFIVDDIWVTDPKNPFKRDDASGSFVSLVTFPEKIATNRITYRIIRNNIVEFRLYRPAARMISVVGDFNNWNPENDMLKPRRNGTWHLRVKLPPGKYRYQYIVDGKWTFDLYNRRSASSDTGDLCSVLVVPPGR